MIFRTTRTSWNTFVCCHCVPAHKKNLDQHHRSSLDHVILILEAPSNLQHRIKSMCAWSAHHLRTMWSSSIIIHVPWGPPNFFCQNLNSTTEFLFVNFDASVTTRLAGFFYSLPNRVKHFRNIFLLFWILSCPVHAEYEILKRTSMKIRIKWKSYNG